MASLKCRNGWYHLGHRVNGKMVWWTLNTQDKKEAKNAKMELERADRTSGSRITKTPVPDVLEAYLEHCKQTLAPRTYEDKVNCLRLAFGQCTPTLKFDPKNVHQKGAYNRWARTEGNEWRGVISGKHFESITTPDISEWLRIMTKYRKWHPVTSRKKREVLSALWGWALKTFGLRRTWAEVEVNPVDGVQTYSAPAPIITFLDLKQQAKQLEVLGDTQIQRMVAVYIYAGLRLAELLHLQQEDVDMGRRLIYVRRKIWPDGTWQPKRGRNRAVPISSDLFPYVETQIRESTTPVINRWFFPSPQGHLWPERNFARRLRALNEKAGLEWSPADFRHTFASMLIQKGESAEKIASLMGNSAAVVLRHYGALLNEQMASTVEFKQPPPGQAA